MFGFPINSQGDINKYTNDVDSGFPKIQQREVFYSVKDGSFDDPFCWQTASGRVGKIPSGIDDVYMRHSLSIANNINVNNLYFNGTWAGGATNRSITINGNLIITKEFAWTSGTSEVIVYGSLVCYDILNMTNNYNLGLYSEFNYVNKDKFISGAGTISYYKVDGKQAILDLPYKNLTIFGGGLKTLQNDLVISGNLDVRPLSKSQLIIYDLVFDIGDYAFTINGTSFIGGNLRRTTNKKLLFIGAVTFQSFTPFYTMDFSGNPEVEFRGGISNVGANNMIVMNSGTGKWRFTTNNQNIQMNAGLGAYLTLDAQVEIESGITLTLFAGKILLNNTINGISGTSNLINKGVITFATQNAAENSMTTGLYDFTTTANTVEYSGNYSATIPSRFPTFHNLTISGTGTKTLGVNTTLNGNLDLQGNNVATQAGILECSTYNLSIFGFTYVGSDRGKGATLSKNGAGSILFVGKLTTSNLNDRILLTGNPNVEMRGGMDVLSPSTNYNTGTGTWTFSTNSQTLTSYNFVFSGNVFIDGAITITNGMQVSIYGTLDGNNVNSKWVLNSILDLYNSTTPFATLGSLDYTTNSTAKIGFRFNGNYTLPTTTFQGLRIGGTGTKTLSGNTLIQTTLDVIGNTALPSGSEGFLECSTYNLQVNGATTIGSDLGKGATFTKSGTGSLLFIGAVSSSNGGDKFLMTGNPTIEFRNGYTGGGGTGQSYVFGTGNITFTTNNQTLGLNVNITFQNNILISGAITLAAAASYTFNGTINGDNVSSKLLINASINITYNSATKPMATGILDTSTNLNTWIYGNANQDILGGPSTGAKQVYRNLTLNGGGTKTLQGYVSVLNTYTLTSPATLNNNGYTLTNP